MVRISAIGYPAWPSIDDGRGSRQRCRCQPGPPGRFFMPYRDSVSESHQRHPKQERFIEELLEPRVRRVHRANEPELRTAGRFTIDQALGTESVSKAAQLAGRQGSLREIDKVGADPTLRKEPKRFSRVGASACSENLHLHWRRSGPCHACALPLTFTGLDRIAHTASRRGRETNSVQRWPSGFSGD